MCQGLDMWFVLVLVSICVRVYGLSNSGPLVSTKAGTYRGLQTLQGYVAFLGVPYGVVNESNPFGPAQLPPDFDETFIADEANACPQIQNGVPIGTIDCLTMNIYVPSISRKEKCRPVMVWIHGGAFIQGSAARESSDPASLLRNDVIVVAINYRLGAYGFMCLDHPNVPGNQGLKDQVLALTWINEHIEAFGGDPTQITIFGESAGGMSVNLLLLSQHQDLFHRAIIQSGPALTPWLLTEADNTIPLKLAAGLGFKTTKINKSLEFLSTVDPHFLVTKAQELMITSYSVTDFTFTKPCIEKSFEGVQSFLTESPMNISNIATTAVIIGYNNNEMANQYEKADSEYFSNYDFADHLSLAFDFENVLQDAIDDVSHFYIGEEKISEELKSDLSDFATDFVFGHPTQRMAKQLLANGVKSVYRYIFSYSGGRNMMTHKLELNSSGAAHGDELGYLFDLEMFNEVTTVVDKFMLEKLTTLWANFAKHGDPTPDTTDLLPVKWEPITSTKQLYLDIDTEVSLKAGPFHDRMAFWDLFYKVYAKYQKYKEDISMWPLDVTEEHLSIQLSSNNNAIHQTKYILL